MDVGTLLEPIDDPSHEGNTATTAATTAAETLMSITLFSSTRGLDKGVNLNR